MLSYADKHSKAFRKDRYIKLVNNEISDIEKDKLSSHWYKSFDDMAKKTMLRQLITKWGVMSVELVQAIENDNKGAIIDGSEIVVEDLNKDNDIEVSTQNTPQIQYKEPTQAKLDDF